jgi:hypothetical protein
MNVVSTNRCGTLGELRAVLDAVLNSFGDKVLIIGMNEGEYVVKLVEGLKID